MNNQLIVFSDLDGTILDNNTYQFGDSQEGINLLLDNGAMLVFCSSKTPDEQIDLQRRLSIRAPFIFENGAGIAMLSSQNVKNIHLGTQIGGYNLSLNGTLGYSHLKDVLMSAASVSGIEVKTFDDLADDELMLLTGLDLQSAMRAKKRYASVTIASPDDDFSMAKLQTALDSSRYRFSKGGRFYTLTEHGLDKGSAVLKMLREMNMMRENITTTAIGDASNDLSMLSVVDRPYLLQCMNGIWVPAEINNLVKVPLLNGKGFTYAVKMMLNLV
jgi:mannosyl-3-phosphoglycerate phosphatase family protein